MLGFSCRTQLFLTSRSNVRYEADDQDHGSGKSRTGREKRFYRITPRGYRTMEMRSTI